MWLPMVIWEVCVWTGYEGCTVAPVHWATSVESTSMLISESTEVTYTPQRKLNVTTATTELMCHIYISGLYHIFTLLFSILIIAVLRMRIRTL